MTNLREEIRAVFLGHIEESELNEITNLIADRLENIRVEPGYDTVDDDNKALTEVDDNIQSLIDELRGQQ